MGNMSSVDEIIEEAKQLPQDQRLALVHRLLEIDEPPISEDVENAWDMAIRERIERYDSGKTSSRPAGEVFTDIDRKLG